MSPNNGQPMPTGNGMPQVPPQISADVDRLREDFRTFLSDCQMLLRNATNLSGEGASIARASPPLCAATSAPRRASPGPTLTNVAIPLRFSSFAAMPYRSSLL